MAREIHFEANETCDRCGDLGAWDFMGDYFCRECVNDLQKVQDSLLTDEHQLEQPAQRTVSASR